MDDQTGDMEIFESKQDSLCVGSTYDYYHRASTSHFTDKKKKKIHLSFWVFTPQIITEARKKCKDKKQIHWTFVMLCRLTLGQLANLQEPTNWDTKSAAEDERRRWTTSWEPTQSYSHYQPKPTRGESSTAEQAVRWDSVGISGPRSHFLCLCFSHHFTLRMSASG